MKNIADFLYNNLTPILIGFFCLGCYFYFAYAGNRICDCETTEKYSSAGNRTSINRFYHK